MSIRHRHARIEDALRDATDTQHVVIGDGALDSVADVFERSFAQRPATVVADENTFRVAGAAVNRALDEDTRDVVHPFVFPAQPTLRADYENIAALVNALREHDAIPVAVGSGTINDIVKRAAFECERPYMIVATAASMDGYTSFGASITKDGHARSSQTSRCWRRRPST
jgi:glycerol-1-phosphate dehydrogenase [NAD(P)+]